MGFLSDLIENPLGAVTGATAARRQANRGAEAAGRTLAGGVAAARGELSPYAGAGRGALAQLLAAARDGTLAPGYTGGLDPAAYAFRPTGLPAPLPAAIDPGLPEAGFTAPNRPFTAAGFDFTADPGYRFRLHEGLGAVERSAAAGGKALSGQTLKALNDYAQGLASREYGNAYDRALGENRLAYDRALGEDRLGFDRGLALADRRYGQGADAFDRTLRLNDLLYGRQLDENRLAYDRALTQDQRREQRFYRNDANRYGRLSDLIRLGYGASGDLAGLSGGAAGRAAGSTYDAARFGAGTTYDAFGRALDQGQGVLSALTALLAGA